jgi:DNA-binding NarL/FixJ family response regulator
MLVSSGDLKQATVLDLDRLGCSGFLQKPYRLDELWAILATLLSPKQ